MHKQTRRELETAYNKGKKMNNDNNRLQIVDRTTFYHQT